jgi:hypothetical protein
MNTSSALPGASTLVSVNCWLTLQIVTATLLAMSSVCSYDTATIWSVTSRASMWPLTATAKPGAR